jgi:hypothetical protein
VEKKDVGGQGTRVFVHERKGSELCFVGNNGSSTFETTISPHALDFFSISSYLDGQVCLTA